MNRPAILDNVNLEPLFDRLSETAEATSALLDQLLPPVEGPVGRVLEAMRYSALSGGKRLRPHLVVESARLFACDPQAALRVAAALEMVHCYSLIHDDLPAMDDSDLRRGLATVHKEYDEATAILAGDGLLTEAFAVLTDDATDSDATVRCHLVSRLAAASGSAGMVGGQMIDLSPDRSQLDLEGITQLQRLKTGALITFACESGAILGRATPEEKDALIGYAADLGLAFQIVDDLLDAEGSEAELGKPTGQDEALGKATFVGQLGREGARERAAQIVSQACKRLEIFGEKAEFLRLTATFVLTRRS